MLNLKYPMAGVCISRLGLIQPKGIYHPNGYREGSVITNTCCSCRGPELVHSTHMWAYNSL